MRSDRQVTPLGAAVPRPFADTGAQHELAEVVLPVRRVAPPRRLLAAEEWRQRHPVALQRHVDADRLADRRHEVDVLREAVDDRAVTGRRRPGSRTMPTMW